MADSFDVVVIGAGAAGVGAGRRLARSGASYLLIEARERAGGRGRTIGDGIDLGCGWLHSAPLNIWTAIAEASGFTVARFPAPWERQSGEQGFPDAAQADFRRVFAAFEQRIETEAEQGAALPAAAFLEPNSAWTPLLNAIFSYISGAALADIDARDYARYQDSGINWRVREGYGALIAHHAEILPIRFDTQAAAIDFSQSPVRIVTSRGVIAARTVIVTLPTSLIGALRFTPDLPEKVEAAEALPLGSAEKVYFALEGAEEFPIDGHLFGRIDSADTATYHLRSMGRPRIEAYFGGALARGLAEAGPQAMADFARGELANLLGASFPQRLNLLATTNWAGDPLSRGSYSYAKPGCAEMRAVLAAPVAERVFFAGEACSRHRYSTAHGAFQTGYEAADAALAALQLSPSPRA